ncbi:hypothetical protein QQM39_16510 [Streptomyces sp. DT2A-34]|uniref:hypothetical protein n=1 Tax=Streptomyces sp. DT2A-34 TaxID=3051182 RepID=UPI00265C3597|nr:hypothetical protein [Streptomyces sp. DT2A-34]MDO0912391.1 hypothetical protein [Streptomyces sp. DT2A-34]
MGLDEEFRSEAGAAFSFLTEEGGFSGPEQTENGVLFRRADLRIEVWLLGGREPTVTTLLVSVGPDGKRQGSAWLEDVYVAAGYGPPQDVPGNAPNRRSALKRVQQHSAALRRVLPRLLTSEAAREFLEAHGKQD